MLVTPGNERVKNVSGSKHKKIRTYIFVSSSTAKLGVLLKKVYISESPKYSEFFFFFIIIFFFF